MIIVITNRVLLQDDTDQGDHTLFGESQNTKGSTELRFARAEKDSKTKKWKVRLLPEPSFVATASSLPSAKLFAELLDQIRDKQIGPKWVLSVHGYGNTFLESLESASKLQRKYRSDRKTEAVNVVLFSWPSNPGGSLGTIVKPISSYRQAQLVAMASAGALASAIDKLWTFFVRPALDQASHNRRLVKFSMNLHVHSRGNLILETLARNSDLLDSETIFDNIILHQADVDADGHADWVNKLEIQQRIIITINASDRILRLSDSINPMRLGTAQSGLSAKAIYVDFSGGKRVGTEHNLFVNVNNRLVTLFARRALIGWGLQALGDANGFHAGASPNHWLIGPRDHFRRGGRGRRFAR